MKKHLLLPAILLFVLGCQTGDKYQEIRKPMSENGETQELPIDFSPDEILMLKEMLQTDLTPGEFKLQASTKFSSDKRNKDFLKRSKKALNRAFAKTFGGDQADSEESLPDRLKKNIMKSFLQQFVYSLEVYKLVNGKIRFHIYLMQDQVSKDSYFDEFNNNGLIDLNHRVDFLASSKSQIKRSLENIQPSSEPIDYLGGAIELEIEFLNIGLPHKKQVVKGKIRYRRYYRYNNKEFPFAVKTPQVNYGKAEFGEQPIVTIDVNKTFSYADLKPKLSYMNITFGRLLDRFDPVASKSLGLYDADGKLQLNIDSIYYDFNAKKIVPMQSKTHRPKTPKGMRTRAKSRKPSSMRFNELVKSAHDEVINQLQLKRFWYDL